MTLYINKMEGIDLISIWLDYIQATEDCNKDLIHRKTIEIPVSEEEYKLAEEYIHGNKKLYNNVYNILKKNNAWG
jgi:hypothetical protein